MPSDDLLEDAIAGAMLGAGVSLLASATGEQMGMTSYPREILQCSDCRNEFAQPDVDGHRYNRCPYCGAPSTPGVEDDELEVEE